MNLGTGRPQGDRGVGVRRPRDPLSSNTCRGAIIDPWEMSAPPASRFGPRRCADENGRDEIPGRPDGLVRVDFGVRE